MAKEHKERNREPQQKGGENAGFPPPGVGWGVTKQAPEGYSGFTRRFVRVLTHAMALRRHARRQPPKGSSFPFSNIPIRACQRQKPHFSRLNRFS